MAEFTGQTDQTKKVKLTSTIERIMWARQVAAAGAQVRLDVFTHFVGNGAALQIELTDATGKSLGTFKDELYGNRFWANLAVPLDARDALFAEVKLPKHGLKQMSAPLLVTPPVEIANPKWSLPEGGRGDILKLTADVRGAYDGADAEITIWEYDPEGAHELVTKLSAFVDRKKVEVEWEFDYHEDIKKIPTAAEREGGYSPPEYIFRVNIGGVEQVSERFTFKDWIEFKLTDQFGEAVPDAAYVLTLADDVQRKGKLDANGVGREEGIPPGPVAYEFPDFGEIGSENVEQEAGTGEFLDTEGVTTPEDV